MLKFLFKVFLIILTTVINVFLCMIAGTFCMVELVNNNFNKYFAFSMAILVVILTQGYLVFYSRIRNYIKEGK